MKSKSISKYDIGERIAYLRGARGLKQSELALASKITQSMLSQIESGAKSPSIEVVSQIAGALDLHPSVLFAEDDVHVFDMKRLRRKYTKKSDLNDTLYRAIIETMEFAKKLGF